MFQKINNFQVPTRDYKKNRVFLPNKFYENLIISKMNIVLSVGSIYLFFPSETFLHRIQGLNVFERSSFSSGVI